MRALCVPDAAIQSVARFAQSAQYVGVRGRGVRPLDVAKELFSHADDREEESEEADFEGRREAEGREEDEEEVSTPFG